MIYLARRNQYNEDDRVDTIHPPLRPGLPHMHHVHMCKSLAYVSDRRDNRQYSVT